MTEHLILNDGRSLPEIGFGTYPLKGDDGYRAIRTALDAGYRLIDSARNYGNEEEVGRAIRDFLKESGTPRDEVTVQTKIPGRHHEFDLAIASGRESLATMGLDYIDVVLIHWPNPITGKFREAWRALVELREQGVARTIGTSNFTAEHLAAIIDDTGVTPAINQIELHPYFTQAGDARRASAAGRPHSVVEPAWQSERAVRRARGGRSGRRPQRDASPGDPALAHPTGLRAAAQVGARRAPSGEP